MLLRQKGLQLFLGSGMNWDEAGKITDFWV
jgi:hypothetical protein